MKTMLLPAITATRAARIEAAHDRRPNHTEAVIIMTRYTASNPTAVEECTNSGHAAAFVSIRARHQASGLDFMERLNRAQAADRRRENLPRIAAEAIEAHRQHDQHREQVTIYEAIADRVTTTPEGREEAESLAEYHRKAAAQAQAEAERLERVIATTSHSDRADISQTAAVVMYETGNFALACKAAGKAIGAVAAANGCTATRTKVKPITAAEAEAITSAHPNTDRIPFNTREGLTAGFTTIEYRNSKRFPAGYYMVKHYHTAAPCVSYETFTSDEDAPALATNGGINAILDAQAAEDIAALFDRAKLSERERLICRYMMDNTAATAGTKAVAEHQAKTAERVQAAQTPAQAKRIQREADKQTEDIRSKAQRQNAMSRAGIYSDTNQRKTLERIRAKLDKAKSAPADQTPAEAAEREARGMAQLQANRHRESQRTSTKAAPMFSQTISRTISRTEDTRTEAEREAAREYAAQGITWREDYPQPQTVTEAESRAAEQRAEQERRQHQQSHRAEAMRTEYRRACRDYNPSNHNRSAFPALDAQAAYYVFFEAMTPADQLLTIAATKAAEAAEAAQKAAEAVAKAEDKHKATELATKAAELAKAAQKAKNPSQRESLRMYAEITEREAQRAAEAAQRDTAAERGRAAQLAADVAALRAAARA